MRIHGLEYFEIIERRKFLKANLMRCQVFLRGYVLQVGKVLTDVSEISANALGSSIARNPEDAANTVLQKSAISYQPTPLNISKCLNRMNCK